MKRIPLTQGKFAIVDDEDYERLNHWKWQPDSLGYAVRTLPKAEQTRTKTISMHRDIMGAGMEIDHINGDRLDNRKSNLRFCTHSQNCINQKLRKDSTSGYKGVTRREARHTVKIWRARVGVDGKRVHVGDYETREEAAQAYNEAAKKYHGEHARLNVIGGGL